MTPQIKQRIEQIRRGEVPDGYKKTKVGVVPNEWEETRFKKMFSRLSRKNKENNDNVLTISAQYGLISQRDFFNKDIASEDKSNYFLLHKGEFAYNKSYSNGYPFGALKRLDMYDKGIVSPLYICFSANENNECPDFYVHYFEAGMMNREIQAFAQEGARNHGLLNISVDDFFNSYLLMPPRPEQEKIAEILAAQDKLIALKEKLIEEKKRQKKALMQQLLTGKQRFHVFFDEWCHKRISDICDVLDTLRKPLNASERAGRKKEYPYYGANGIVDYIDEYLLDDSVILLAEDGGNFENFNNKPIAYWVEGKCWVNNHAHILKPQKKYCEKFVFYALEHKDIRVYINGTTRSKLTQEDLLAIDIFLPTQIEEQQMIAKILGALDREVLLLQKDLDQEKQKKKALMQLLLTGIVRTK